MLLNSQKTTITTTITKFNVLEQLKRDERESEEREGNSNKENFITSLKRTHNFLNTAQSV